MKITVCIGSSCHIKGSRQVVEQLQYLIAENNLGDLTDENTEKLLSKFQNMFSDITERELFLKQVMNDWLGGKISIFGGLSTNKGV